MPAERIARVSLSWVPGGKDIPVQLIIVSKGAKSVARWDSGSEVMSPGRRAMFDAR